MCSDPDVQRVIDEMNEALGNGALFNPEMFGSMLRAGDNPILRWRDTLVAALSSPSAPAPQEWNALGFLNEANRLLREANASHTLMMQLPSGELNTVKKEGE